MSDEKFKVDEKEFDAKETTSQEDSIDKIWLDNARNFINTEEIEAGIDEIVSYTISNWDSDSTNYDTYTWKPTWNLKDKDCVTTVDYRGFSVPVYIDEAGQSYYCHFNGEDVSFGSFNTSFIDDIHYLVDEKLDVIYKFPKGHFFGAKLKWFDNAGHRDIQLTYRLRILKVWLVEDASAVNTENLINEADQILAKLTELTNKKTDK